MSSSDRRLPVASSRPRKLPPPARRSAAAPDLTQRAEVTLVVRSRGTNEAWRKLVAELTSGLPSQRRYLTRAEFARNWAASPDDLEAVRRFAVAQRLEVVSSDAFRRCVVVAGTLRQLARAFDVEFRRVEGHPRGPFRTHSRAPRLPKPVRPLIECILGLDDLPAAKPHAVAAAAPALLFNRKALLGAYSVPMDGCGKGQCIALIELGGGIHKPDFERYFAEIGVAPPRLLLRGIGAPKNAPAPVPLIRKYIEALLHGKVQGGSPTGNPNDDAWVMWTIEATMDVAVAGTAAPEATLLVVRAPETDQGQYHAVTSAIADAKNDPSVLSCSWGDAEAAQTPGLMHALNRWFEAAAVLGITVCCSSGDDGDGAPQGVKGPPTFSVQFPASSPAVLACGGTTLDTSTRTEIAWSQTLGGGQMAGGGGFSTVFEPPPWQTAAGIAARDWLPRGVKSGQGRAVPDVAAKANMVKEYQFIVGGLRWAVGGTSAATPLWAAVIAGLNAALRARLGSIHEPLYTGKLGDGIHDIVEGSTGPFRACKGWDACTGWGSPRAKALLRAFRSR